MDSITKLILTNSSLSLRELANLISFTAFEPNHRHPDVLEIGETDKNSIGISEIQSFISWVFMQPYQADYKLGVIQNADKLTVQAQNALLKVLEEHPENTSIVLVGNSKDSFLPTVLSRLVIVNHQQEASVNSLDKLAKEFVTSNYWQRKELLDGKINNLTRQQLQKFIESLLRYTRENISGVSPVDLAKNLQLANTCTKATNNSVGLKIILDSLIYYR